MSGQPTNTISDVNKFKNEYLETLNLQQDINNLNLQANKNYLKNGSLPPQSQMTDNRTTAEIMADTEKLKTYIIDALKPIANSQFSSAIVQGICSHFLNSDNSLLRFFSQRVEDIVKEIKKNYKFGIIGDTNDVEVLVSFIANLYSDRKNIFSSTKDFLNSTQGPYGGGKTLGSQDIDAILRDLTDIQRRTRIGMSKSLNDPSLDEVNFLFETLFAILKELKKTLPSNEQLKSILDNFDSDNINIQNGHDLKAVYDIIDTLPKISQVSTIFKKIEMNLNNKSPEPIKNLLLLLIDQFSTWMDTDSVRIMREFKENYIEPLNQNRNQPNVSNTMNQQTINYFNLHQNQNQNQNQNQDQNQNQNQDQNDIFNNDEYYNMDNNQEPIPQVNIPNDYDPAGYLRNYYQSYLQRPEHVRQLNNPPEIRNINRNDYHIDQNLFNNYMAYREQEMRDMNRILRHSNNQLDYIAPNDYALAIRDADVYNAGPIQEERTRLVNGPVRNLNLQSGRENYSQISNPPSSIRNEQLQQLNNGNLYERTYAPGEEEPNRRFTSLREIFYHIPLNNRGERELRDDIDEMNDYELIDSLNSYGIRSISNTQYRNKITLLQYCLKRMRQHSSGHGINKKIGRPRGNGIIKKIQDPTFVGFGISEINQKKLNDGILTIRRNTRSSYADMPSKKISPEFQLVVKSMIGGNIPRTNELNRLSEDEINYLNKIVKRSDMEQKMNIPTPSKDKLLKDSDQFEIMKGEILSGNDSKELVKKFKLMVLKLSRNGMLPKNETNELLETLITLGY